MISYVIVVSFSEAIANRKEYPVIRAIEAKLSTYSRRLDLKIEAVAIKRNPFQDTECHMEFHAETVLTTEERQGLLRLIGQEFRFCHGIVEAFSASPA